MTTKIIAVVFLYLIGQMSVVWIMYKALKNPSVVDISWSVGLMIAGLIYLSFAPLTPHCIVVSILLILWALRLASYLWYTRVRPGHIDKRYQNLSDNWKINKSLGFFLNFQLQGILIFIISFIFYLISSANHSSLTSIDRLAIFIIIVGIAGESIADIQLYSFKKRQKNKVCNVGLWHYSRHPNYFFDWLTWLGFTLFALQSPIGYLGLISLLTLYIIFTRITGPLTERGSIQSRGQKYLAYQKETSMFFPWFKRKNAAE